MYVKYDDPEKRDAEMRTEYVTTKISMRELALKYGLTLSAVEKIAKRDGWSKAKKDYLAKLQDKTLNDTAKGITARVTSINAKHFKTWDKMLGLINEALDHASEQLKYEDGMIKLGKLEVIAKVMLMIQQGQRLAKGIGDPVEVKKLEIAFKRLELEAKKLAGDPDEIEDDGFMDALKAEGETVWGDEVDGNEIT